MAEGRDQASELGGNMLFPESKEIDQIAENQKEIGDEIQRILRNYRKDSEKRKTQAYLRRRIEDLEENWTIFRDANGILEELRESNLDHVYFTSNFFDKIKDTYTVTKRMLEGKLTEKSQGEVTSKTSKQLDEVASGEAIPECRQPNLNQSFNVEIIKKQNATMTLLLNFISKIDREESVPHTRAYYTQKMQTLNNYWYTVSSNHLEIMSNITSAELDKHYLENNRYSEIEDTYQDAIIKLQAAYDNSVTHSEAVTNNQPQPQKIKLPPLQIPKFDGDYKNWSSFQDLFKQLIHNNEGLGKAQKMFYLQSNLTGEVSKMLQHLKITDDNYDIAWELLETRYSNTRLLVSSLLQRLLSLPTCQSESASNLKRLHDTAKECLAAIKNLNIKTDDWGPFLVHILTQKLDKESHKHYEERLSNPREIQSLEDFYVFLEYRFQTLETIAKKDASSQKVFRSSSHVVNQSPKSNRNVNRISNTKDSSYRCTLCKSNHYLYGCKMFNDMSSHKRKDHVKKHKLCNNCLHPDHDALHCKSNKTCRVCKKRHNTLIHVDIKQMDNYDVTRAEAGASVSSADSNLRQANQITTHVAHAYKNSSITQVMLATAMVTIPSKNGKTLSLRALIDQGSQATFITENAAQQLRLERAKVNINIDGIGNKCANTIRSCIQIVIRPRFSSDFECTATALIMKRLTNEIPSQPIQLKHCPHMQNLVLADPTYFQPGRIDMIIGADIFGEILLPNVAKGPKGTPVAQQTKLGWILTGKINSRTTEPNTLLCNVTSIEDQLKQFWEIEELPTEKYLSNEDENCQTFYKHTIRRQEDGRYVVRLPFNEKLQGHPIGESRHKAVARLIGLERKFQKDKKLEEEYRSFLREYLELGHMKLREIQSLSNERQFYLPHHAVLKTDSTTTKLRVVFDASAKSSTGISLNDKLHTGPTLQQDLFNIILRWRKHEFAFKADIEKMYRQIKMAEIDQHFQCILWRDSPEESIKEYQLTTVTYGTRSAPYLAVQTLLQLAKDEEERYPLASKITMRDFYVDDLISGCDTLVEAKHAVEDLTKMLKSGGFRLRKWASHCPELLNQIPNEDIDMKPMQLNSTESDSIKALGVQWHPASDSFTFKVDVPISNTTPTKRSFLSEASKIFDPLGWLTPTTILAKIMFQDLWLAGLQWDDPLPPQLAKAWTTFKHNMSVLQDIKIPRWIHQKRTCKIKEVHGFCDASEKAYAAVVYFRTLDSTGNVIIHILAAKSKVAPINKTLSLPRLELCAAVLLANLVKKVTKAMELTGIETHAWTDSTVVLAWLRGHPSKWKTFVANRVSKIHSVFNASQWHHIRSKENPADHASRGIQPIQLINHPLWWTGPRLLTENPIKFPQPKEQSTDLETRKVHAVLEITTDENVISELILRHSSLRKLTNILVYCLRFVRNMKQPKQNRLLGPISVEELQKANSLLIKTVQQKEFTEDIGRLKRNKQLRSNSSLRSLDPFLDSEELLRVGGRLHHAEMEFSQKHPIILPYKHALTTLIIQEAHEDTLHGGNQLTLAQTRQRYWILKGQSAVKQHLHRCIICFRHKTQSNEQLMGNLPKPRTLPLRAFTNAGVDYAGPISIRMSKGRGSKTHKGYIVIFICLSTKAIHLEAATDLTAEAFIAAFKRCVGRRGIIKNLYSDNGTNFVLANKILQMNMKEFKACYENKILQEVAEIGTTWHFIPPSSPHFGGLWEAGVKSTKYHLKRVIGENKLTYEELATLLIQIEACLNSRPLCPMTSDPEDLTTLTPGHFLIGGPMLAPPTRDATEPNYSLLTRWRLVERLHQDFWKKWSSEYLSRLQERPKWTKREANVQPGQIVIIKDEQIPPTRWALARVINVHPGSDGLVRVATVKTKNNVIKRPIHKLCVLPTIDNADVIYPEQATKDIVRSVPSEQTTSTSDFTPESKKPEKRKLSVNYDLLLQKERKAAKAARHYTGKKIRPVTTPYSNLIGIEEQKKALNPELHITPESEPQPSHEKPSVPKSRTANKATFKPTTLFSILALLFVPILAQVQKEPIKIMKFETQPGLYFEEVGEVQIINSAWKIFTYYDLQNYWMELNGLRTIMKSMAKICNTTTDEIPFCIDILSQLEHQFTHIEENNEILQKMNQRDHARDKRGALDIVGNVANKLFGVLDADYANYMNHEIEKTKTNEQHLLNLIRNQTSVMESTVNVFKKTDEAVKNQFVTIDSQIKTLSQLVRMTETNHKTAHIFTSLTTHTMLVLNNCQRTQDAILDTLTDVQHGKINALLITPMQLRRQIALIKEHLPTTLAVPGKGENQVLLLYRLITVRSRVLYSRVLFSIEIPLLINEFYQLYKLIPIPTQHNDSFVLIEPHSEYISVGLHKNQYYPMTNQEVNECSHLEVDKYLCKQSHPIYNIYSNISRCEIELLNHQSALSTTCKIRSIKPSKFWIQLHQPNQWLYSLDHEYTFNVICANLVQPHTLNGSGIINLREDCIIRQSSMTITGHRLYQSRFSASFLPKVNLTQHMSSKVSLSSRHSPSLYLGSNKMETENILKELKQIQEQEDLPEQLSTHDVHQFTITYLLVAIILVAVGLYLFKQGTFSRCCRRPSTTKEKPTPAKRSTHLTIDDFSVDDIHNTVGENE